MPVTAPRNRPHRRPINAAARNDVLTVLEYAASPMLPRDLARKAGLPVPQVREILRQLVAIGRARNVPGKGWAHKPPPLRVETGDLVKQRKQRNHRRRHLALAVLRQHPEGLSALDLSRQLGVRSSTVGTILRDAIALGRIERVPTPTGVVYRLRGVA